MNAPAVIAGAAVTGGTAAIVTAQEIAVAVGAGRPTAEIIQIIGAVTALVGLIGGIITPLVMAFIAARVKSELAPVVVAVADVRTQVVRTTAAMGENTAITQATFTKAAVIEGHVNSEKTSDAKTIEFLRLESQLLRDQLADKDRSRDLLAQSVASVAPLAITRSPAEVPSPATKLDEIATNTEAIERNTKTQPPV